MRAMALDCLLVHVPKLLEWSPYGGWTSRALFPSTGTLASAAELERRGLAGRILHLGVEKQRDPSFRLVDYVRACGAPVVAFALDSAPQVADVLLAARQLQAVLPEVRVVVFGLTASWFWRELCEEHPELDFVLRGEPEVPLGELVEALRAGRSDFDALPNLAWRGPGGVRASALGWEASAAELEGWPFAGLRRMEHAEDVLRQSARVAWALARREATLASEPTLFAAPLWRGCGGACPWAFGGPALLPGPTGRSRLAWRSPERLAAMAVEAMGAGVRRFHTCFDALPASDEPLLATLDALGRQDRSIAVDLEAHGLPSAVVIEAFARNLHPSSRILLAPQTGDEALRGRLRDLTFSNAELERVLEHLDRRDVNVGLSFTLGLPGEDRRSAERTLRYQEALKARYAVVGDVSTALLELAPGAPWFVQPERFGLTLRRRTLADFIAAHEAAEPGLGYDTRELREPELLALYDELYLRPERGGHSVTGASEVHPALASVRDHGGPGVPELPLPTRPLAPEEPVLFEKSVEASEPVTASSMALFRLGELCDHDCPMCCNSGLGPLRRFSVEELLRRQEHLRTLGFQRVMLTGGEPLVHPGFWQLARALAAAGMRWDLNTNGGQFAAAGLAERARGLGLQRAIVSLHSHVVSESCVLSGIDPVRHAMVLGGVAALREAGAEVWLNAVLTRVNLASLPRFVVWCAERFPGSPVKLCFPLALGKGADWPGTQLDYYDVRAPLRAALKTARAVGAELHLEAIPCCVSGEAAAHDMGRSAFGETHYLHDGGGRRHVGMRWLEARERVYGEPCADCEAIDACPGVGRDYVLRRGLPRLEPFSGGAGAPGADEGRERSS